MTHRVLNLLGSELAQEARATLMSFATVMDCAPVKQKVLSAIGDATILLTGHQCRIDEDIIRHGTSLRIIATPATGLDHIDLKAAERRGIRIVSLRGETEFLRSITGTAELAWGLILMLCRHLHGAVSSVKELTWNRDAYRGYSLSGKMLGVIGVGRLGSMVATYGKAFGMRVIGHDPSAKDAPCTLTDFDTVLAESDVISLHVPLTDDTTDLIDAAAVRTMKRGALLINTSRGGIVNEVDVLQALQRGHLGGYGADVVTDEFGFPKGMNAHPLIAYAAKHDNVLITPHIGGLTVESRTATDVFIAEKLKSFAAS